MKCGLYGNKEYEILNIRDYSVTFTHSLNILCGLIHDVINKRDTDRTLLFCTFMSYHVRIHVCDVCMRCKATILCGCFQTSRYRVNDAQRAIEKARMQNIVFYAQWLSTAGLTTQPISYGKPELFGNPFSWKKETNVDILTLRFRYASCPWTVNIWRNAIHPYAFVSFYTTLVRFHGV